MGIPSLRDWIFSAKAFLAACLALYIALWFDLPRPYWCVTTVYVAAQPFAGPTLTKAVYRLLGTILGGVGAVVLVPNLATSPEMLSLGLALWTAGCLFLSLMDRRPHSYIFLLAGYTAPIIGFPSVDDPGAIFITAISRVQEIGLGIVCASVVGALVLPDPVGPAYAARAASWLDRARLWALDALQPHAGPVPSYTRLAAETIEIDVFAAHLGFDPASPRLARRWAEMLRARMQLLIPLTYSLVGRIEALRQSGAGERGHAPVAAVKGWLQAGAPETGIPALRHELAAASPPLHPGSGWADLLHANLVTRLGDLVDLHSDCAQLTRHIRGGPGRPMLAVAGRDGSPGSGARHVDFGLALRSSGAAVLAILAGCFIWIITAWPDGSSLPVMAAVVCSFFASQDNPVGSHLAFAKWTIVAVLVATAYDFALLPLAHDYETLVLLLAPIFLIAGVIAAKPANALIGLAVAANLPALLGLQGRFSADFAGFINSSLPLVGGMWLGAVITYVARVVQPHWVARRLLRANWLAIAQAAERRGRGDRAVFASLLLDRAAQLASRVTDDETWLATMAEIRVGLNVVDLRRARHAVPPAFLASLDRVLDGVAAACRARAGSVRAGAAALRAPELDEVLAAATWLPPGAARDDMVRGLVGIRLGLFPDTPQSAALSGPALEQAA